MKNSKFRKGIVLGLIVLFVGAGVIPSLGGTIIEKKSNHPIFNGNTLYVGGAGPNNYTQIQNAIDNASDGDTVYVYDDSAPYNENLIVSKSIDLIGEDKNNTIIDGMYRYEAILVLSDNVTITGLKLQNGNSFSVKIESDGNIFSGNVIEYPQDKYGGIKLHESDNNTISDNNIINSQNGVWIGADCNNNLIFQNTISSLEESEAGVYIENSNNNNCIAENIVYNYETGIYNYFTSNSTIMNNIISCDGSDDYTGFERGILVESSFNTYVLGNSISNYIMGIRVNYGYQTNISFNKISNSTNYGPLPGFGIVLALYSYNNVSMYMNDISNCTVGVELWNQYESNQHLCFVDTIQPIFFKKNNFQKNEYHIRNKFWFRFRVIIWENNYWGKPRLLPKAILGFRMILGGIPIPLRVQFDWRPALKPHDIPGSSNFVGCNLK